MGSANGLVVAAPRSGSGKTLVTLGLLAALRARGLSVAPAKAGPDYIDAAILARTAAAPAINLDPWAMPPERLRQLATSHAAGADLLLVEGAMGLFDGAVDGQGSTADLAAGLGLPVILVVDAEGQGQSVAAMVAGFAGFRRDVDIVALILNRVGSTRHERMLAGALRPLGIPLVGMLPRRESLHLPGRYLGLVLPGEVAGFEQVVAAAAAALQDYVDIDRLLSLSRPVVSPGIMERPDRLGPLGQRIAVARDEAFSFIYQHFLEDWRKAGAELSFFSPLQDESAPMNSDAIFLPGGYPELHAQKLAASTDFLASLEAARDRGALLYGECGGYMVLGEAIIDGAGRPFKMAGLLPLVTDMRQARRTLGYRRLTHGGALPWPRHLLGHEFHYSSANRNDGVPLFAATTASGEPLPPMGAAVGRVLGSYAHVIGVAAQRAAD